MLDSFRDFRNVVQCRRAPKNIKKGSGEIVPLHLVHLVTLIMSTASQLFVGPMNMAEGMASARYLEMIFFFIVVSILLTFYAFCPSCLLLFNIYEPLSEH
jgi:hypothetical protein